MAHVVAQGPKIEVKLPEIGLGPPVVISLQDLHARCWLLLDCRKCKHRKREGCDPDS